MTESPTYARTEIDQAALAETVREALAQLAAVEERLQTVLRALSQASDQTQAPVQAAPTAPVAAVASAPTPSPETAAPPLAADEPGVVDNVAWEVEAEDMEIPITHPSRFQPGQTIAIGDGPTREVARIRTIMGTRLLCVRGIDDTTPQHHDRGRNIYIVR